jgi:putative transposase
MKGSRFSEEQIIGVLREHEAGAKTEEVCRRHGISSATLYKWKSKYGGLEISEARRLKALEDENRRLKRLLPSRCWTTRRSRTYSEKTSEACGAKTGGEQGDGAPRAESATRLPIGRHGSFDPTLPGQATGRFGASTATARASRGAPTIRVSALRLDAGPRRSCDEPQAPLSAVP